MQRWPEQCCPTILIYEGDREKELNEFENDVARINKHSSNQEKMHDKVISGAQPTVSIEIFSFLSRVCLKYTLPETSNIAQQVKTPATKPSGDVSSLPDSHKMEEENQLLLVVPDLHSGAPASVYSRVHACAQTNRKKLKPKMNAYYNW